MLQVRGKERQNCAAAEDNLLNTRALAFIGNMIEFIYYLDLYACFEQIPVYQRENSSAES